MYLALSVSQMSNKLFDTLSTITNPIKGSLGFLTSDNNYDLSLFAGLIVDISFSKI